MTNINDIIIFIEEYIFDNTIEILFKKLNIEDKNLLKIYYKKLLIIIYYSFFEINTNLEIFKQKMMLNNYLDARVILLLLLPYINIDEDTNNITSFNDMITKKYNDVNIKLDSPKYVYTNLQYNRCKRDTITEIKWNNEFFIDNYNFLINTIKNMCNKLYINWIEVIPYNLIDYKNEKLYLNTLDLFNKQELIDYNIFTNIDNTIIKNLQCLNIGDIYETITNEFYYQIKNVKWLIYDIKINDEYYPLIVILNAIFSDLLSNCLLPEAEWKDLNIEEQKKIEEKWKEILLIINKNEKLYSLESFVSLSNIKKILKALILFFNNYYKDIDNLIYRKEYVLLDFNKINVNDGNFDNDLEDNEDSFLSTIKFKDIKQKLNNINIKYIYDFIRDSLEILKLSWYSIYTLSKDKSKINSIGAYKNKREKITLKNIYNFSKSLCHINHNNIFTPLPKFWESLNKEQRDLIINRIYNKNNDIMSWFNITNNLRSLGITNINKQHNFIYNIMNENMINFVFTSFITRGILSKLIPNFNITDKKKISDDVKSKKIPPILANTVLQESDSNHIYTDSYYFLTSQIYKDMKNQKVKINENSSKKIITYFNYNNSNNSNYGRAWYSAYALDWMSQINFYNKFINNRVIYVTGGTGVGKSTQIPKLLLYAQKAILYNSTTKIICTQPRKKPTKENADIISQEMGVPIEDTKNFYLQFKHQDDNHIKKTIHTTLKFVTDGTFLEELKNNPILRKEPYYKYNNYDAVIIDESHEHNANMDIILSLMKNTVLYNNTIKLVIISATMDNDEPIYRRFYRDINDNKSYPLNYNLIYNNLDRINVDRRIHISPPGKQQTRFVTTEKYIEDIDVNLRDPVLLTKNIVSSSNDGDVLIFQPGIAEIEKLITELNKTGILPEDTIALPFHGTLPDKPHRDIMNNISSEKFELGLLKSSNFTETIDPKNGPYVGKYKRVVIVATNIAEASITIKTLKFVIDTGTQKTSVYDYIKRKSRLVLTTITDSSRLQRKGRVGRLDTGSVYYLYEKGKTSNIKTQYNICNQDIKNILYDLLYNNSGETILLNKNTDPNNISNKYDYLELQNTFKKYYENFKYYFNIDKYYDYYGKITHYDYDNYENISYYYETGYSPYNLNDTNGKFYLIHPEELDLTRNILGDIITTKAKGTVLKNNLLESTKLNIFWDTLRDEYFIDIYNNNIIKTELGIKFTRLRELFEFDDYTSFKIFLYSFVFNVQEEIIRLIFLLQVITKFSDTLIPVINNNGVYKKGIIYAKKRLGVDCKGDLEGLDILLEYYHNYLNKIGIKYDNTLDKTQTPLITEISRNLSTMNSINFQKIFKEKQINISHENFSYLSNDMYNELRKTELLWNTIDIQYNKKEEQIINFCTTKLFLDPFLMRKYFKNYSKFKNLLMLYYNKNLDNPFVKPNDYNLLDELTIILKKDIKHINTMSKYEKILSCFILSESYNIVTNITNTKNYVYLYEPIIDNIYKISPLTRNNELPDTFVAPMYLNKLLYYNKINIEYNVISLINYINPKLMENLYKIYNLNLLDTKISQLINTLYINNTKNNIKSNEYKEELKSVRKELENNTDIYTSNKSNLDKINIFYKKIRELL